MTPLKISPFMRVCISTTSLRSLTRKGGLSYLTNLNLDKAFDKALDKARLENVRNLGNLIRPKDPMAVEIPLPPGELGGPSDKATPASPVVQNDKKKAPALTDADIEEPLKPLLDYLDDTLAVFRRYFSETGTLSTECRNSYMAASRLDVMLTNFGAFCTAFQSVMTKIWKEVLIVIEGLLVPPLSDQPTDMKPLTDKEVDIVFKWLKVSKCDPILESRRYSCRVDGEN